MLLGLLDGSSSLHEKPISMLLCTGFEYVFEIYSNLKEQRKNIKLIRGKKRCSVVLMMNIFKRIVGIQNERKNSTTLNISRFRTCFLKLAF